MKKILRVFIGSMFVLMAFVMATPAQAAALPNWDITGTWTFDDIYQGTHYLHTMTITSFDPSTGVFSGTGFYNADPSLTWTVSGTESGNDITYHLSVLTVAPGVYIDGTGTINSSTSMSGTGYQSNIPGTVGVPNIQWTATNAIAATPVPTTPVSKDECKKDGWMNFIASMFKNQGECVSWFNHQ